jgi:hypothetical protein
MKQTVSEGPDTDIPGQRYGLGIERYPTPCGPDWGHGGNFPGYLVYALTSTNGSHQAALVINQDPTSTNGSHQAALVINQDPTSLPPTTGPTYLNLLIDAYCSTQALTRPGRTFFERESRTADLEGVPRWSRVGRFATGLQQHSSHIQVHTKRRPRHLRASSAT